MIEYFVDVVVRLKIQTDGIPKKWCKEDYNFSATIVDTEIKDVSVSVIGKVNPATGAIEYLGVPDETDEVDEWEALFCNYYRCSECGEEWQDEWDCQCNDRCPKCNAEIEPYMSTDLTTGESHE